MDNLIIPESLSVQEALEILDESYTKTLFLIGKDGSLQGSLTDGDIRRWILKTGSIKGKAADACNRSPFLLHHPASRSVAVQEMHERHLQAVPVVNDKGGIESILLREELTGKPLVQELLGVPVVIMAGGRGTRLDPFTRILPKPLIPVGNQPVIELIMQAFARYGADTFYISLNHKASLIKAYFEDQQYPYKTEFIEEDKPLGTAGALRMLEGKISGDLFVSNCDSIIRSDYNEILRFHRQGGFDLTVIVAIHKQSIPYGVCDVAPDGSLLSITEKPEYSMLINTGMYVLRSELLKMIPEGEHFHITDLISRLKEKGNRTGVFPVPERSYHDLGQWEEYRNSLPELLKGGG